MVLQDTVDDSALGISFDAAIAGLRGPQLEYVDELMQQPERPLRGMEAIGHAASIYMFFLVMDWRASNEWTRQGRLVLPVTGGESYWALREAMRALQCSSACRG
jgi:hypothetical protein